MHYGIIRRVGNSTGDGAGIGGAMNHYTRKEFVLPGVAVYRLSAESIL